jgi:thioredoxin-related protein
MKNIIIGLLLGLVIGMGSFIAYPYMQKLDQLDRTTLPMYSLYFNKHTNPHKDLAVALKKAKKENKNILLLVGGNWCPWCRSFDSFLEKNKELEKLFYTSFEVVRVYYGSGISKEGQTLLKQFPNLGETPSIYILDNNAKLLHTQKSSMLELGYSYDKKKLEEFIKKYSLVR